MLQYIETRSNGVKKAGYFLSVDFPVRVTKRHRIFKKTMRDLMDTIVIHHGKKKGVYFVRDARRKDYNFSLHYIREPYTYFVLKGTLERGGKVHTSLYCVCWKNGQHRALLHDIAGCDSYSTKLEV